MTDVRLELDHIDSEVGAPLIAAVLTEHAARYRGVVSDATAPDEFDPPGGAFFVAYVADQPMGCGGLRRYDDATAEIKRMYVVPAARRQGLGRAVLRALEDRARAAGYRRVRLETGTRQPEAISLYESEGYQPIEPYGYYRASPLSRCFEKDLDAPFT